MLDLRSRSVALHKTALPLHARKMWEWRWRVWEARVRMDDGRAEKLRAQRRSTVKDLGCC
jgi:hypothetical protein